MRLPTFFELIDKAQCLLTEHEFQNGRCVHCGEKNS